MTIFLKSHCRRPISCRVLMPWDDPQAQVPAFWCERCGGEIYEPEESFCVSCRKEQLCVLREDKVPV